MLENIEMSFDSVLKNSMPILASGAGAFAASSLIDPLASSISLSTPVGSYSVPVVCALMAMSGKLLQEGTEGLAADYLPSMPVGVSKYVGSSEEVLIAGVAPAALIGYQNKLDIMTAAKLGLVSYAGSALGSYLEKAFIEPALEL